MEAIEPRSRCFFDIVIGGLPCGRIVFELYNEVVPKTCDNFRSLCAGDKGLGENTNKPLTYNNVIFHRVVKDFIVQAGDFSNGNGTGGESIYGGTFEDENFVFKHDQPFLLSMANRGKNTNGSQFFITTQPAPHLDNIHVVFGRVVGGTDVVRQIENLSVDTNSRPLQDVRISKCGELIRQVKVSKKKKHTGSSNEENASGEEERRSSKKKHKEKKEKKSKKEKKLERIRAKQIVPEEGELQDDIHPLATVSNINPDDIPDVPVNKFLLRGDSRNFINNRNKYNDRDGGFNNNRFGNNRNNWSFNNRRDGRDYRKPKITKSGRTIKGRGVFRYRTPSRSRSRSRSGTPIHWRKEEMRVIKLADYEKQEEPAKPANTVASTVAVVQLTAAEENKRSERQDRHSNRAKSTDKDKRDDDNDDAKKIDYNALDYEDEQQDMRQHLLEKRNQRQQLVQYPIPGLNQDVGSSPLNENSQVMLSNKKSDVLAMALGVQVKTGEDPPTGNFRISGYDRNYNKEKQRMMHQQQDMNTYYGDVERQMSPGMETALAMGNKAVMSSVSRRDNNSAEGVVEQAAQNFKEREKLLHQRLMAMAGNIVPAPSVVPPTNQKQQQMSRSGRSRSRDRHQSQQQRGRDKYHGTDRRDNRELHDRRKDGDRDRRDRKESGGDRRTGYNRSGGNRSGDRRRSNSRSRTPSSRHRRHSSSSPKPAQNRNGTTKSIEKTHTPSPDKERFARKAEQIIMLKKKMEAEIREQLIKKQQKEEAEREQQRILKDKQRKAKEEAEMLDRAKRAQRDAAEKEKLLKTVKALKQLDAKKQPSANSKSSKRVPRSKRSPSTSSSSSSYSSSSSSSSSSDSSADRKKRVKMAKGGGDKKFVDKSRKR